MPRSTIRRRDNCPAMVSHEVTSVVVPRQDRADASVGGCKFEATTVGELTDMSAIEFLPRRLVDEIRRLPGCATSFPFLLINQRIEPTAVKVEPDPVACLKQGKAAADSRFGRCIED